MCDGVLVSPHFHSNVTCPDNNRYAGMRGLHIECNPKHWMKTDTMIRWLSFVQCQMIEKGNARVAVIVDSASQHIQEDVLTWCRTTDDTQCVIRLFFIAGGLTSILQPADVYANKPVKAYIKMVLRWLRATRQVGDSNDGSYCVDTFRGELALVVAGTFCLLNHQQHNAHHTHYHGIRDAFKKCGFLLTQQGTAAVRDLPDFEAHLATLKRSTCYSELARAPPTGTTTEPQQVVLRTDRVIELEATPQRRRRRGVTVEVPQWYSFVPAPVSDVAVDTVQETEYTIQGIQELRAATRSVEDEGVPIDDLILAMETWDASAEEALKRHEELTAIAEGRGAGAVGEQPGEPLEGSADGRGTESAQAQGEAHERPRTP
eukprot:GHVU01131129.1.p1 GENE.GHVU01131129.1~~GHVU01131129.1.p1  ORF type:complete len:374 (+),score=59.42 GHVU01131129.1:409-1530(+)